MWKNGIMKKTLRTSCFVVIDIHLNNDGMQPIRLCTLGFATFASSVCHRGVLSYNNQ